MKRRCASSITQITSASSTSSRLTWFLAHHSVPADVTHIGAHISASNIAAVGLRSRFPVQTIRTFFIANQNPVEVLEHRLDNLAYQLLASLSARPVLPLLRIDPIGSFQVCVEHELHLFRESITEYHRVDFVVACDTPPVQVRRSNC